MSTSDPKVITMVVCPYCNEEWVREDDELVCKTCEPSLKLDLAVAEMVKAVNELTQCTAEQVRQRIDLLMSIHITLTKVIKDAKPRRSK